MSPDIHIVTALAFFIFHAVVISVLVLTAFTFFVSLYDYGEEGLRPPFAQVLFYVLFWVTLFLLEVTLIYFQIVR